MKFKGAGQIKVFTSKCKSGHWHGKAEIHWPDKSCTEIECGGHFSDKDLCVESTRQVAMQVVQDVVAGKIDLEKAMTEPLHGVAIVKPPSAVKFEPSETVH